MQTLAFRINARGLGRFGRRYGGGVEAKE